MPPWNSPNKAEMTNSEASPSKGRKRNRAKHCMLDPISSVRNPPIRSDIQPKTRRLTMPHASSSDSICAPRAAP